MRTRTDVGRTEAGSTLVEVLIASLITGTAVLTFLMGVTTSIGISVSDRQMAEADARLRSAAETIAAEPYLPCDLGAAEGYADGATRGPERSDLVDVVSVRVWDGSVEPVGFVSCAEGDAGLQELTLRAVDSEGDTVGELTVFKRRA